MFHQRAARSHVAPSPNNANNENQWVENRKRLGHAIDPENDHFPRRWPFFGCEGVQSRQAVLPGFQGLLHTMRCK
jgi:hypothetical protein